MSGILGYKPVNIGTICADRISAVSGFRVQGAREGSFGSASQAKGQERKGFPMREASSAT